MPANWPAFIPQKDTRHAYHQCLLDLFPVGSDRELAERLTQAAMKAEGYSETLLERSGLTVDELTSLNERSQATSRQ
jgi:hypothetical protein